MNIIKTLNKNLNLLKTFSRNQKVLKYFSNTNPNLTFPSVEETLKKYEDHLGQENIQQDNSLVNFSILEESSEEFKTLQEKLNNLNLTPEENKALATMIGAAVGDALGANLEGILYDKSRYIIENFEDLKNTQEIEKIIPIGQYTDDTALGLCVLDSLLQNKLKFNDMDLVHRFFCWWVSGYNNGKQNDKDNQLSYGVGKSTRIAIQDFLKTGQSMTEEEKVLINQKNGNGSMIRMAPVIIGFQNDLGKGIQFAESQSYTTHNGEEAADCCRLIQYIGYQFINNNGNKTIKQILDNLGEFIPKTQALKAIRDSVVEDNYEPYEGSIYNCDLEDDRNWDWKNSEYEYSPFRNVIRPNLMGIYSCDALAMSLHILYNSSNFKEAILKTINIGGDADSVAAITGMLAGAFYGYDKEMAEMYKYIQKWDDSHIGIKALKLQQLLSEQ